MHGTRDIKLVLVRTHCWLTVEN